MRRRFFKGDTFAGPGASVRKITHAAACRLLRCKDHTGSAKQRIGLWLNERRRKCPNWDVGRRFVSAGRAALLLPPEPCLPSTARSKARRGRAGPACRAALSSAVADPAQAAERNRAWRRSHHKSRDNVRARALEPHSWPQMSSRLNHQDQIGRIGNLPLRNSGSCIGAGKHDDDPNDAEHDDFPLVFVPER